MFTCLVCLWIVLFMDICLCISISIYIYIYTYDSFIRALTRGADQGGQIAALLRHYCASKSW